MYHRFGHSSKGGALTVRQFRRQLDYLKNNFTVARLDEAISVPDSEIRKRPVVVLTIDDGYLDFFEFAYPLLLEFDLPATIFVTSGFIEGDLFLWPDRVKECLHRVKDGTYRLDGSWGGHILRVHNDADRDRSWHEISDRMLYDTDALREIKLSDLFKSVNYVESHSGMAAYAPMSWEHLKRLSEDGFEIGDHTWRHSCLPTVNGDLLLPALEESKAFIEKKLDINVTSFAYPNGTLRDVNSAIVDAVNSAGFSQAVMSVPLDVQPHSPLTLPRLFGQVDQSRFVHQVDGFGFLRRKNASIRGDA